MKTSNWREVFQHGDFILGSIILRGTFRRISQLWDNAHLKLGEMPSLFFVYNGTIYWLYPLNGFLFSFLLRDHEHILFSHAPNCETLGLMSRTLAEHVIDNINFIYLLSFFFFCASLAQQQSEMTKFCVFSRTRTTGADFLY